MFSLDLDCSEEDVLRFTSLVHFAAGWWKWNAYGGKGGYASIPKHLVMLCKVFSSVDEEVGGIDVFIVLVARASVVAVPESLFVLATAWADWAGARHAFFDPPGLGPGSASGDVHEDACILMVVVFPQ